MRSARALVWILLTAVVLGLALALGVVAVRRAESVRLRELLSERDRARATGSHRARLQHPHVDLSRCIGCGTCVAACPEDGVLELVHGQAVVVHGARCVGHGRCAAECPVGAIALTLGDVRDRRDLPVLRENRESSHVPGLFLAGEVTGYALVRTAIAHGTAAADEAAKRARTHAAPSIRRGADGSARGGVAVADEPRALDLVVVGAGPAGIACALRAKELGLAFVVLEQDELGGTVAKYPRRKLVMTQPVDLPLVGRLSRTTYSKEELVELWRRVADEHALPIEHGVQFTRVERLDDGVLRAHARDGRFDARSVVLALGRRGTPRRLGVPGEELAKVSYALLDAHSYRGRRVLVVGGGDSAIEAALGLAEQPKNRVTISYRKDAFFRLKSRNESGLAAALARDDGSLEVLYGSDVVAITERHVELRLRDGSARRIENDEVFVFAGGTPPTEVLEASGVSFDPTQRESAPTPAERGTGIVPALCVAFALAVLVLAWVIAHADYYAAPAHERPHHADHALLAPTGTIGLACGIGAALLVCANLAYLARRRVARIPGSLRAWMTAHVATGIGALLLVIVHGAMAPRSTVGGHAAWAMAFLVLTGAIGRYLYSFVPRAANGRELELDEVRGRLAALSAEWDLGRDGFGAALRDEVERVVGEDRWQGSPLARIRALLASRRAAARRIEALRRAARAEGVAADHVERMTDLARRAQRTALMASHYEELRALLASWRWFHRWTALFLVLVVAWHVWTALRYADLRP